MNVVDPWRGTHGWRIVNDVIAEVGAFAVLIFFAHPRSAVGEGELSEVLLRFCDGGKHRLFRRFDFV